jgi:hypothetical protein
METVVRLSLAAAAGFLGGLLADYVRSREERQREEAREERVLLEDASPIAARHSLSLLEERPVFSSAEREQPYAMMHDTDDVRGRRVGNEPSPLEESKSNPSADRRTSA